MEYKYIGNNYFELNYKDERIYFNDISNMVHSKPLITNINTNKNKIQTEKQRIKIITTNKCNLNCKYCFTKKNRGNESLKKAYVIELINKTVNKNMPLEVSFIGGGEPTLNYSAINEIVSFINDKIGKKAKYSIISNGIFDSQVINLIKDNQFDVVISLDGSFDLFNMQQSKKIDILIYKKIIDNILFLQKTNNVFVNTVLGENAIKRETVSSICDYYKGLGIEKCDINLDIYYLAKKISENKIRDILNMIENYLLWSLENHQNYIMPMVFNESKFSEQIQCPSSIGKYMLDITVFPFNKIGYCYQNQTELISSCDYSAKEIRNNCVQSSRKYVLELAKYKKFCKKCIARQICTLTNCPHNFYYFKKNNWCNNLQNLRTGIIELLLDLNIAQ